METRELSASNLAERLLAGAEVFASAAAIRYLIVHYTATDPQCQTYTPTMLEYDHRSRGWQGAGYHFYATTSGELYQLRGLQEVGAHCRGYNRQSLALAYEGGYDCISGMAWNSLNQAQRTALQEVIDILHTLFPDALLRGHRDMPGAQTLCPCLNVNQEFTFN